LKKIYSAMDFKPIVAVHLNKWTSGQMVNDIKEAVINMYQFRYILSGMQRNAVLFHLFIQKRAMDAEQTGGLGLVVICFFEGI